MRDNLQLEGYFAAIRDVGVGRLDGEIPDDPVTFGEVMATVAAVVGLLLFTQAMNQVVAFWRAGGFA